MQLVENFLQALESLRSNKMRALLTMLGIIIGISSVIAIISLGGAMTNTLNDQMQSMGVNNITISVREKNATTTRRAPMSYNDSDLIKSYQIEAFEERFKDDIAAISIQESIWSGQVKDGVKYANVSVSGVNEGYFDVNSTTLASGRLLQATDMDTAKSVCVVSNKLVSNIFDHDNVLGELIRFYDSQGNIHAFTIVGIYTYEQRSASTTSDKDLSTDLFIPISLAKKYATNKNYSSFTVMTGVDADVNAFTSSAKAFLNRYYRSNAKYEVNTFSMSSMVDTATSMLETVSLVLAIIAGISLVVGGIGVMNIMLVSVTERTHEIGIRKALGAQNSAIRMQFVIEAMVVTLIGGIIGIVFGITLGTVGASILGARSSISIPVIFLAVGFSMCIGVFFGFYPANKAAALNPIDALRYE